METKRPFDILKKAKNKKVIIELSNGRKFIGTLISFDLHPNVVLEDVELEDGTKKSFVFLRSVYGIITAIS